MNGERGGVVWLEDKERYRGIARDERNDTGTIGGTHGTRAR